MPKSKTDKPLALIPPKVIVLPTTNKYNLEVLIKWGEFERPLSIDREQYSFLGNFIDELNKALRDGSETNPVIQ